MFFKESHPVHVLLSAWTWSILFGIGSGYKNSEFTVGFTVGFCSYTFTEFFIHYFLFHIIALKLTWPKRIYYMVHGRHHKFPAEYTRVVLPIAHQWGLVVILFSFWYLLLALLENGTTIVPFLPQLSSSFRFQNACVLGSGIMFGYSFYEIAHLYGHGYPLLARLTWLENAKWFHLYHHTNKASKNYGFVSPFWDLIFGTICNEEELNPFMRPHFGWTPLALATALPIPVPFYHFIMLRFRNAGRTFKSYGRDKQQQTEFFG